MGFCKSLTFLKYFFLKQLKHLFQTTILFFVSSFFFSPLTAPKILRLFLIQKNRYYNGLLALGISILHVERRKLFRSVLGDWRIVAKIDKPISTYNTKSLQETFRHFCGVCYTFERQVSRKISLSCENGCLLVWLKLLLRLFSFCGSVILFSVFSTFMSITSFGDGAPRHLNARKRA